MADRRGIGPDFVVVGAMKCGTTTLHEQLGRQTGIAMTRPKEPNFFSDDDIFARGIGWYRSLFSEMPAGAIRGESSTHYSKRTTHPDAVGRLASAYPDVKIVYLMRNPIRRLISHDWHERHDGRISLPIDEAIHAHPELVDHGRYAFQLEPFFEAFGHDRVCPMFLERLIARPQDELERLCVFLGHEGAPAWDHAMGPRNVGTERMRRSQVRQALVAAPILTPVRRKLMPRSWSERLKSLWRIEGRPSRLSRESEAHLRAVFDAELARLGRWMGLDLSCDHFDVVADAPASSLRFRPGEVQREASRRPVRLGIQVESTQP